MSHSHSAPLEVTRALSECAGTAGFRFDRETAIVAVQHMLRQTVDLFQTIAEMGLELKNIFALGKVYSNSASVIETLRNMGVTVVETTPPEPGEFHAYFERDVSKLWQIAAQSMTARGIKRVLVLDDGGVAITSVPPEVRQRFEICGVEQTSLGMFLFEMKPPPFAVIAWARAAVKLEVGGPIFSQCFIDRLNTEFIDQRTLRGRQVGVIGMGSIGRAVSNLAARQGNRVLYYDPQRDLRIPATQRDRITRVESLAELMVRCDYVVGCSGRNPFKNKWPLPHKPGLKLLSASGGDQEFGPIINYLKRRPGFSVMRDTWDMFSDHGPSGRIQIAYLGYPYNFVSRAPDAVPTHIVQLETGGLLAALMQANILLELVSTGQVSNSGIHRVSPKAQRFVYEQWLKAMSDRQIDLIETFGYDRALFTAAQQDDWFVTNSEPRTGNRNTHLRILEDTMIDLLSAGRKARAFKTAGE